MSTSVILIVALFIPLFGARLGGAFDERER